MKKKNFLLFFLLVFFLGCEKKEEMTPKNPLTPPFFSIPAERNWELVCDTKNPKTVQKWRNNQEKIVLNAGFFNEKNVPLGYTRTTEKTFGTPKKYEGFVGFNKNGALEVGKTENFSPENFVFLQESFPLLLWKGEKKELKTSEKLERRTLVGEKNGKIFWIFFTTPVSFQTVQNLLKQEKFSTILNLDGGSSTGISSKEKEIFSLPIPCVWMHETKKN